MIEDKKVLAVIPARGGSKRLPRKNVLPLAGKPLIAWTIEAGKGSKYIDKIVVSSDDDEILEIARNYKVDTIKRPSYLATDEAKTVDVVKHVLENQRENFKYIILLQPTSPLRKAEHIDEAFEILIKKNADAVISVCPVDHPVQWCNTLPDNLSMINFISEEVLNKRSQELPVYYRINGAIYIVKTERFITEHTFFLKDKIFAYIMDRKSSIDIDDKIDFKIASVLVDKSIEL